jgi:uncharacterized DUF497 family protein
METDNLLAMSVKEPTKPEPAELASGPMASQKVWTMVLMTEPEGLLRVFRKAQRKERRHQHFLE